MLNNNLVNKTNMLAVAEYIQNLPIERFQMNTWITPSQPRYQNPDGTPTHSCETTACIAGWTVRLLRPWELAGMTGLNEIQGMAAFLLGLDLETAHRLFLAVNHPWEENYYYMSGADAARTLRHLAHTSQIQWEFPQDHDCTNCGDATANTDPKDPDDDLPF